MVTLCFKKRSALAQVPLLLGFLIMAVAVPVATKLVQQNQDTRNRAASIIGCAIAPCSTGQEGAIRCTNNQQQRCDGECWVFAKNCPSGCSGNYCRVVPTSTPRPPTSTPTKAPNATPTKIPTNTPTDKPLSYTCSSLGGSCVSYGCTCGTVPGGTCQGEDECCKPCPTSTPKPPTSTPTKALTATPTIACDGTCQFSDCLTMSMETETGWCPPPQYCCGEKIIVNKCTQGERYCSADKKSIFICKSDKSGYTQAACAAGRTCDSNTKLCVLIPTSTPTKAPTATPTMACNGTCQYSDCSIMGMKTGTGSCPQPQYCCGEKVIVPKCNLGDKYCSSDKSGVYVCKSDRSDYTLINCSTGKKCDLVTDTCVSILTPTLTKIVTPTPTKVEQVTCSSKVIGRCGPEGGCSYGYRCLFGAGNFSCSYDPACGAFTATATPKPTVTATPNPCSSSINRADNCPCLYSNQCTSGYCAGSTICQPKPTPTPTSNLKQTGDSCTKDGDCASGKCTATTLGLFNKKCEILKAKEDACKNNSDCLSGICDQRVCKEVGEVGFVCKPGEFKCSDSKTLLTCTETGSGWIKQVCSSCINNVCNGLDSYPVCSGGLEGSDFDCPTNWACTGAKVPDKIGLWYCEPKSAVNANSICTPGALRCNGSNSQASLETCSPDGRRWLSTVTCPVALSMAGYNYSCKQMTSLEAQCRPATEQEMKEFAIEFVAMNTAAVAMPFAIGGAATTVLPAMMANPAIVSGAFRIVRIGNSLYSITNAAKECQGFDGMTNEEKTKCVLAAGYAVTATVDAGIAGAGFLTKGSQLLTGIEIGNDVANLALGGVNAYNQCENGTNSECYWALISSGIDLVSLKVDINQAKQWSKTNLNVNQDYLMEKQNYEDKYLVHDIDKAQSEAIVENFIRGELTETMSKDPTLKVLILPSDEFETKLIAYGKTPEKASIITGVFRPRTNEILIRESNMLDTPFHELTHYQNKLYGWTEKTLGLIDENIDYYSLSHEAKMTASSAGAALEEIDTIAKDIDLKLNHYYHFYNQVDLGLIIDSDKRYLVQNAAIVKKSLNGGLLNLTPEAEQMINSFVLERINQVRDAIHRRGL